MHVSFIYRCPEDPSVIRLELKNASHSGSSGRNPTIVSACGLCGRSGTAEDMLSAVPRVGSSLRTSAAAINAAMKRMRSGQRIFSQTGGTHAAAIFNPDGEVIAFGEDIARYNALDKAIGRCLLESLGGALCGH